MIIHLFALHAKLIIKEYLMKMKKLVNAILDFMMMVKKKNASLAIIHGLLYRVKIIFSHTFSLGYHHLY